MDSSRLIFSLLGPPSITFQDAPVQIKRRKVRFLAYYLACQEYPVTRESLSDLFWPGRPDEEARKNLREALSNLRSSLPANDFLLIHGEYVSLDQKKVVVDVREFEKVTSLIRKNLSISEGDSFSDAIYSKVREGISYWRASGFIPGAVLIDSENFEKWAVEKSDFLETWHQMMLEWLTDHCISTGNLNEALNWLSQALLHDRLNTDLNLLMLSCLRDLGAWSEMQHFCDELETIYQENGISTLPQLLQNSITRSREQSNHPANDAKRVWNDSEINSIPYINLNQRFLALKKCLNRGGIALIRGESGSGKSRLLREFYNSLEVVPRLVYCGFHPSDKQIPYQVLVEAIRRVISTDEWKSLSPIYAKALYPLFPEIQGIRSDISPNDITLAINLQRLIPESFFELFKILAKQRKAAYFYDDAQWVDADTMRVLTHIYEKCNPEEIGSAIIASRIEIQNPAADKFIGWYGRNHLIDVIDIEPLNEGEVAEIVFTIIGHKPSREEITWLSNESGGNPELLIDILQSIKRQDQSLDECVRSDVIPINQTLINSIQNRLVELSELQWRILFSAAILGKQFPADLLEVVSAADPEDFETSLQLLQNGRIIKRTHFSSRVDGYEFIHGVIYRFILQKIPPETKHLLNLRAISAYQNHAADTLENHIFAAGLFEEAGLLEGALQHWISAGDKAKKKFHNEQVNQAFGNALRITQLLGERCPEETIYLLVKNWAGYCVENNDLQTGAMVYSRSMLIGQERKSERLIGFAESGHALMEAFLGNFKIAGELINRSIERLREANQEGELARSYIIRGIQFTFQGNLLESINDFSAANEIFKHLVNNETDELVLLMTAYQVIALSGLGRAGEAIELAQRTIKMAELRNHSNYGLIINATMSFSYFASGDYTSALNHIRGLDEVRKNIGLNWWILLLQIIEAKIYLNRGELKTSWELINNFIHLCEENEQLSLGLPYAYYLQSEIYRNLNDFQNAQYFSRKGLVLAGNQYIRLRILIGMGMDQYFNFEVRQSQKLLEQALQDAQKLHYFYLENLIRSINLVLFSDKLAADKFEVEIGLLQQRIEAGNQVSLFPVMRFLEGKKAIREGNTRLGIEKFLDGYQKAKQNNDFQVEMAFLQELINNSPTKADCVSERRTYRQLLKNFEANAQQEELTARVKKFVALQQKLIKN